MSKVTIWPEQERITFESIEGDLLSMEGYELLVDFERVVEFLRLEIEVEVVNEYE